MRKRQSSNIRHTKATSFFFFCMLFANQVVAQLHMPTAESIDTMNNYINSYLHEANIPGGLAAVVSKGEIVHLETYGMANVELSVPVSDSTVFEIGSISKQFVTAVVMMLREEDKIKLDDPIQKFLNYLPGEWMGVTIEQLMTHTSGIPDYEEIRTYDVYRYRLTPEEVIKIAQSRPMDFSPGTGRYYSNTGYYLLSMIVEHIEGKPLGQILQKRIFEPLEMKQTRMADPEAIIYHRAEGYWVNKAGELINRNATETSSTLGAGGLLSSVYDMAKWDYALYGNKLLSDESKTKMWTAAVLPDGKDTEYGYGWRLTPFEGLKTQRHGGQVAGFMAYFARFPEQEFATIVFLNRYRVNVQKVNAAVVHTFVPDLGPIPE